ncbi:MAG: hypothetical protein A6F71_10115 [Cycloclasticus sp. symbiont of Poecilosclerida sp. M]|nr:MAG: hypothetical protein A6F71_10115 [Cycloclasticus sp. symbiont of Poecilosclerida sp. M]
MLDALKSVSEGMGVNRAALVSHTTPICCKGYYPMMASGKEQGQGIFFSKNKLTGKGFRYVCSSEDMRSILIVWNAG